MTSQDTVEPREDYYSEGSVPISRYVRNQCSLTQAPLDPLPVGSSSVSRRTFLKAMSVAGAAASLAGGLIATAHASTTAGAAETALMKAAASPTPTAASPPLPAVEGPGIQVKADEGTEAILEAISANETDCLFFCGGTDNFPVMEAVAKFKALDRPTPELIMCPHEHVAMSAAHGHFMVSRKPQVVMVHVDIGTQNVGGAVHNAWKGQAGVIFMAGRTPWTTEGELRGGRDAYIHWLQETYDQGEIVRQYTKWDYELRTAKNAGLVVQRAYQLAASEPCGPVYLTLPREVMMEKMDGATIYPPDRYRSATTSQGDAATLREAAQLLAKAEHPVILVNMLGRHPEAVAALVQLAESMALPLIDSRERMNFPTTHSLHLGYGFLGTPELVKQADVVLVIDQDVPYAPVAGRPPNEAKIIAIDIDPVKHSFPLWGFPVDVPITADSSKAVPVLYEMAQEFITQQDKARYAERLKTLEAQHNAQREQWQQIAVASKDKTPISPFWLSRALGEAIDENTIVVNETVMSSLPLFMEIDSTQPGTFFGSGGSSLGWGVAAALGAKLAAPDKLVVCATGDGSFMFSQPAACLWVARRYDIPFLTVIYNNKRYAAVEWALRGGYPEGYAVQAGDFNGASLEPSPQYAQMAESCGAYAETVTDPAEVKPALERALDAVREGQAAVLDVVVGLPM